MPTPDNQGPQIDMSKWGSRAAVNDGAYPTGREASIHDSVPKPIFIMVTAQEIGTMTRDRYTPDMFNQFLLERFKFFGAPVEGSIRYRLAHGAVAKWRDDPLEPRDYFLYAWLAPEYVAAIKNARGVH